MFGLGTNGAEARFLGLDRPFGHRLVEIGFLEPQMRVLDVNDEAGLIKVLTWARRFVDGSTILDLGCGHGTPIGEGLRRAGFEILGIDGSPKMVAASRARLPETTVQCARI